MRFAQSKVAVNTNLESSCLNLPFSSSTSGREVVVGPRGRSGCRDEASFDAVLVLCNVCIGTDGVIFGRIRSRTRGLHHGVKVGQADSVGGVGILISTKVDAETEEPEIDVCMAAKLVGAPYGEVGADVDRDVDVDEENICSSRVLAMEERGKGIDMTM